MSKGLILIVDDDANNRDMLELVLQAYDFEAMSTNRGEKAIPLAKEHQPVLILADINMPGMSGFELTRAIRGEESTKSIPVLLISGLIDPHEQNKQVQEVGANGLIERGMPIAEIIEKIGTLVPDD